MVHAVDGVDLSVDRGETLGVVGESGSGKTVTALTVVKLIAMPPGRIVAGRILWQGRDLVPLTSEQLRPLRAKEIAVIFQEPMTSLNPVYTIGEQIAEVLRLHEGLSRKAALARTVEMLDLVKISNPQRRLGDYPHQFSGGMRQRVMIAMALSCNPKLLIADEPSTALDVTVQAQILALLTTLQRERGMALMLITHDLAVVAETAQRVVVMYAGQQVETGPVPQIFETPRHPYTQALLAALPEHNIGRPRLQAIPGVVPGQHDRPTGCLLSPRCGYAIARCRREQPPLAGTGGRLVRCHFALDAAGQPTNGWRAEVPGAEVLSQ
jgi:dipeptide transport system ATP-binding protein